MAFYKQKAQRYVSLADRLYAMLPDDKKQEGAEVIARLVNAGVVCVPRPAQSTVRLNIVKEVTTNLPINCSIEERKTDNDPTKTYKALVVKPA